MDPLGPKTGETGVLRCVTIEGDKPVVFFAPAGKDRRIHAWEVPSEIPLMPLCGDSPTYHKPRMLSPAVASRSPKLCDTCAELIKRVRR
jgi:hypothetical protein